jgi:hypothetical protein
MKMLRVSHHDRLKFTKQLLLIVAASLALIISTAQAADQPDQKTGPTLSPFGIGGDSHTNSSVEAYARWIPQMAAIGITVTRTPDDTWAAVEGEAEGKWTWETLDAQMSYLEAHHIQFGGILAGNPKWNTQDVHGTLPVNNLPAWSEYVTELAKHVNGRIKYWEVWNEPPNFTGRNQTPADYAKLVVSSYAAAHAVDPTCLVGLAAKSVHINYLDQVIQAGAKDHFDYVVLHPYEVLNCATTYPGAESIFMHIVPTVRKMLAAQDPAKANVPIWFTELGSDAKQGADVPAHALVKAYTMGIAQGVLCINWFEGIDGDSGPMGLLQGNGTPRPAYMAMTQMIKYLGQHPGYLGWVLLNDRDNGFLFQGATGPVLIAWAPTGTTDNIDFGLPVTIVDPLTGNTTQANTCALTDAPILVADAPANLLAQAKSNKTKPFPWGGDYTDAKSVSVTMGEKNVEKGLHTQSADSVAAAVIAYGGAARAGNIPGGNVFMVDPNFLSYTSTPIEITAVVRRDAANDPAQLDLEYESTNGFKKAPVYQVPDNLNWHTATWRIDDSQFVSMWGYNFRLNSGKYVIQSVTVTKLDK